MEEGLAHFFWGGSCNPHKKYELSYKWENNCSEEILHSSNSFGYQKKSCPERT